MVVAVKKNKERNAWRDAETGTIRKRWQGHKRVALVYPNYYKVGMANLGFQSVYALLNGLDGVLCERAFLPESDENRPGSLRTIESGRPLLDFDCVAFSLSFENDYPNVLKVFDLAGLPLPSASRGASLPLVLAGGVACFLNPEPLASFFDCFLLGEAETLLEPFFERFTPSVERRRLLLGMAQDLEGVYVPCFYDSVYHRDGTLASFAPREDVPERIKRVYTPDLACCDTHTRVHTAHTSFDDAYLIEVSRGCPHGCRFCGAGFVYRPPRVRSYEQILRSMHQGSGQVRKIGLLGTAVSDLPDLKKICTAARRQDLQLGFSSLRADALDAELVAALKSGRLKTATIAPETGSERMRRVINKGLREDDILAAVNQLVAGGIPNLKLYFMVGLPTETDADVAAMVVLVKKIKHLFLSSSRAKGHMGTITVSVNSFVPKPFTPFQWAAMDEVAVLKAKIRGIKNALKKIPNVRVHADVPRWAHIQALLSRGDRRVSQLLVQAHQNGGNWPQTFKTSAINPSFFVHRERDRSECLPWDFIDHGLSKDFLWSEYQRALRAKTTRPCPMTPETCRVCGVCTDQIKPSG